MTSAPRSLLRAAADGDANIVRDLLVEGADVNGTTEGGRTALMLAALLGHEEIVALLLNAGANAQLQDKVGLTAMDWATRRGFAEIVQLIGNSPGNELSDQTNAKADGVDSSIDNEAPVQISYYADVASEIHPTPDLKSPNQTEEIDVPTPKLGGAAGAILRTRTAEINQQLQSHGPADMLADDPDILLSSPLPEATADDLTFPPTDVSISTAVPVNPVSHSDILSSPPPEATDDDLIARPSDVPTSTVALINAVSQTREVLDDDTTITAATTEVSTLPARPPDIPEVAPPEKASAGSINPEVPKVTVRTAAPPVNQSLDSLSEKRCPKCEDRYESTRLRCPRDNTLLVKVPSLSSIPSHSSTRPISWLLVAITLGGSAFVAYRANSYFFKTPAPVSSPIVAKTERPAPVPVKTAPVIGGDLVGTELIVPNAEYAAHTVTGTDGVDASGNVTVRVHVNQKGMVIFAMALDGDKRLRAAAVKAAKSAAFSPEKLRGKGRTVTGTITYNFVAPKPSANGPSNVTASKAQSASAASQSSPVTGSSPANAAADPPASDGQFPLTGGPLAGTELNLPKPQYPASARSKGITGTISIVVRVNRAGRVISWRTGEGDSQLRAAALKAAKQATFSPAKLPGKGEVVGTITYNFKF
jgi:TonB family protein